MALIPDGREVTTETGANRLGNDLEGNPVVVSCSHEAIQDYGWRTIWQAGETKNILMAIMTRKTALDTFASLPPTAPTKISKSGCWI